SQLVRSITASQLTERLTIENSHERLTDRETGAGEVRLIADVRDALGNFADAAPELTAVTAAGAKPLPVTRRGPGRYDATAPSITYGQDQQFLWRFPAPD